MTNKEEKTERWLEIIEEGLQLKLEIQNIQDQFQTLTKDLDVLEESDKSDTMKTTPQHSTVSSDTTSNSGAKSSTKARVRAIYEARKARIRAKRAALQSESNKAGFKASTMDPMVVYDEEDKENTYRPPITRPPYHLLTTSTPGFTHMPTMMKNYMTPIKEDHLDLSSNIRCVPKNFLTPKGIIRRSSSKSKDRSSKGQSTLEGDYTKLKSMYRNLQLDYMAMSQKVAKQKQAKPTPAQVPATPKRESGEIIGRIGGIAVQLSPMDVSMSSPMHEDIISLSNRESIMSPIQSADENTSELYTSKILKDISTITQLSRTIPHEQASSANLEGAFHSTFNYPLHSTLNYPLHSSFNLSGIESRSPAESKETKSETTVSSSSNSVLSSECKRQKKAVLSLPPRILEDSYMDCQSYTSESVPTCPTTSLAHSTKSSHSKKSITKGLDENENKKEVLNNTESDCDSSCLSICVDDSPTSVWFTEAEDHTAMYDPKTECLRMLKRQIGQAELNDIQEPVGLSETDFMCDLTARNFSMEATRATIADLSNLSTLASDGSSDNSGERTLQATQSSINSLFMESGLGASANETLISVDNHRKRSLRSSKSSHSSGASSLQSEHRESHRRRSTTRRQMESEYLMPVKSSRRHSSRHSRDTESSTSRPLSKRFTISDNTGRQRTIMKNSPISKNMQRDRKRVLSKRLKEISETMQYGKSSSNIQIQSLGHF